MTGEGTIMLVLRDVLAVPKSAVVYPGSSAWVYVEHGSNTYERRGIRLGREGDEAWEVLQGLREGERVVTTGNVLLDAQATLEGTDETPLPEGDDAGPDPQDFGEEAHPSSSYHSLDDPFREALTRFITASDRMAAALGRDSIEDYNRVLPGLGELTANLRQTGGSSRWNELANAVAEATPTQPAQTLVEARAVFPAFGAASAELAQYARTLDPGAGSFRIYHCPMAPKPGLWIQAKGPVANPFFGASMLRCGEEVDGRVANGIRRETH
jgi:Cu(I)/Ag(I) efflux system membrane fusion protein